LTVENVHRAIKAKDGSIRGLTAIPFVATREGEAMRNRPFHVLACAVAVVAVAIACASKVEAGRAARSAAEAAATDSPEDREALQSIAHLYAVRSDRLSLGAGIACVLTLGASACSLWRREGGFQSIPVLLLLLAGLFQLL
jgi:hypothetical protein